MLAGLAVPCTVRTAAQQAAIVSGRVEIGIPIVSRRPSAAYPTRTVTARGLAPESERRHVVVYWRDATVVTVESAFSFAYTQLSGEWVRDAMTTSTGTRVASGWFVQGRQTLAPRWFVAGRVERLASPLVLQTGAEQQRFIGAEEVLVYRLTPAFTLRVGHRARRGFGRPGFDHQGAASIVWWRRWI